MGIKAYGPSISNRITIQEKAVALKEIEMRAQFFPQDKDVALAALEFTK